VVLVGYMLLIVLVFGVVVLVGYMLLIFLAVCVALCFCVLLSLST
jgi:hypothetical protein